MSVAIGIVAIGRNEGERLRVCLESVQGDGRAVVYVDSGSTDDSAEMARALGVEIVILDLSLPFTAARARNAGILRLLDLRPNLEYVMFVDGDCEVVDGWVDKAEESLRIDQGLAIVCGWRRERYPEASIYNLLCDVEWDRPAGIVDACGGDSVMRVAAFRQAGGFASDMIAGEEPELCYRLREEGWRIRRLPLEMTLHDAAITEARQWWIRTKRCGYAYGLGYHVTCGYDSPPMWGREVRSLLVYGVVIPLSAALFAVFLHPITIVVLAYPALSVVRIAVKERRYGRSVRASWVFGLSCMLGKFPEVLGWMSFWWDRFRGRRRVIVEYK